MSRAIKGYYKIPNGLIDVNLEQMKNYQFIDNINGYELFRFDKSENRNYQFDYCYENPNRLSREDNCQFCSKLFKDNTGLKNHEMICKENPDRKIYNCEYCSKEYKDYRNKIQHEITCELNKNKELYECQYFDKQIGTRVQLTNHETQCDLNVNSIVRIYFCQYCNKEFKKSKLNLAKHEKYYCELNPNAKKPEFKCVCGKIYTDKGNFTQHQNKCELRVNS